MSQSLSVLVFLAVSVLTFAAMIGVSMLIGPRRRGPVKDEPFECGSPVLSPNGGRIHARFYLVAMLFVVFDIETVLMYPWAAIYLKELGLLGLGEMATFVAVLTFGLAYVWRKGGLEWD
jgi:NADH-quinone oxidoreductase subunit A